MSKKEEFKEFVTKHKELIKYVNSDVMTWQKFYEMWDLYGENDDIWNSYFTNKKISKESTTNKEEKKIGLSDIFNYLKQIDMNQLQGNIETLQKGIGLVQGLLKKDDVSQSTYTPRPIYQRFED